MDRRHSGDTPLGLNFSKMAGYMSGGNQNHGTMGLSIRTPKSKKFLQGDGGWERIVWMPNEYKTQLADCIPEELYDKIATGGGGDRGAHHQGVLDEKSILSLKNVGRTANR